MYLAYMKEIPNDVVQGLVGILSNTKRQVTPWRRSERLLCFIDVRLREDDAMDCFPYWRQSVTFKEAITTSIIVIHHVVCWIYVRIHLAIHAEAIIKLTCTACNSHLALYESLHNIIWNFFHVG